MKRAYINDKNNKCDHDFKIPGLEASYCGKCEKWVITDLQLIKELKYGRKKKKKGSQIRFNTFNEKNLSDRLI